MKSRRISLVLIAFVVLTALPGLVLAEGQAKFKVYSQIARADLVKKVVDGQQPGLIIDSRPVKKKYDKGHIPGSLSLPFSQFDKLTKLLPKDKQTLLIFYCGGLACPLSHKSAFGAEKLGYTNIKVYAAGYPDWVKHYGPGPDAETEKAIAGAKKKGFKAFKTIVDLDFVKPLVEGKQIGLLIDSRPKKKKYDTGHIPGALSMPFSRMDKMLGLLPQDKQALIVFYCEGYACSLSHKAAFKAVENGYSQVKVLAAGYPAWKEKFGGPALAAAPKAKAPAGPKLTYKAGKEEGSIDLEVFKGLLKAGAKDILIIDVRDAAEFGKGSLPGSVNIPTDQLEKKLPKMKVAKPIVFVCSTGARSGEAYYMVQDLRPDLKEVYYVDAEITYDKKGYNLKPVK